MAKLAHCKRLFKWTLVILLVGCATERGDNDEGSYPVKGNTQNKVPSITYPSDKLTQQNSNSINRPPYLGNYEALVLTGVYANSIALQKFIQYMVQKYGFSQTYLNGLFSTAHRLDYVIRLESPEAPSTEPSKPQPGSWTRYRNKFLTDAHISNGVEFWRNNAESIKQASVTYGVDP